MRLTISDGAYERETLAYLVGTLSDLFSQTGCNWFERADDDRAELTVEVPAFYADIVKGEIDDKISDIVSVSYKYDFLKHSHIRMSGRVPFDSTKYVFIFNTIFYICIKCTKL